MDSEQIRSLANDVAAQRALTIFVAFCKNRGLNPVKVIGNSVTNTAAVQWLRGDLTDEEFAAVLLAAAVLNPGLRKGS